MNVLSLFFPGVWVHELAHAAACWAADVKVHKVSVQSNAGMVVHDPTTVRASVLIGLAPLIGGSVLAFFLFSAARDAWSQSWVSGIFVYWLAFSIAFHSIPSEQDLRNIPLAVSRRWGELWSSDRALAVKLVKSAGYVGWGIVGWSLVVVAILANSTLLVRLVWTLGLGAVAESYI